MEPVDKHRRLIEGPKRGPGLRVPLFNRLFDYEPRQRDEAQPGRVLARDLVLDSIRAEVSRLLNTRIPATAHGIVNEERTVLNYGVPDFLNLKSTNEPDRLRLAGAIASAIAAYEPRLRRPVVEFHPDPKRRDVYTVTVSAMLVLDNLAEPVSFPFTIEEGGAGRVVREAVRSLPVEEIL